MNKRLALLWRAFDILEELELPQLLEAVIYLRGRYRH